MKEQENEMQNAAGIWRESIDLREAWFHLADKDNQDRFRRSEQMGSSPNCVLISLRDDLHGRLEDGELLATGIEEGPRAHNGPQFIGAHFFHRDAAIIWDDASIYSHGIRFLSVRVTRKPNWCSDALSDALKDQGPVNVGKKRRGRPSVIEYVREIIRELNETKQLNNINAKEIENKIRFNARNKYPHKFRKENSPSRKTINQALRAEGLKEDVSMQKPKRQ